MEFLVRFHPVGLEALPEQRVAELRRDEKEAGERYMREGTLVRMWRLPGQRDALGIWRAGDADELHQRLSALPLFPYLEIEVSPLATHYLEEGPAFPGRA